MVNARGEHSGIADIFLSEKLQKQKQNPTPFADNSVCDSHRRWEETQNVADCAENAVLRPGKISRPDSWRVYLSPSDQSAGRGVSGVAVKSRGDHS